MRSGNLILAVALIVGVAGNTSMAEGPVWRAAQHFGRWLGYGWGDGYRADPHLAPRPLVGHWLPPHAVSPDPGPFVAPPLGPNSVEDLPDPAMSHPSNAAAAAPAEKPAVYGLSAGLAPQGHLMLEEMPPAGAVGSPWLGHRPAPGHGRASGLLWRSNPWMEGMWVEPPLPFALPNEDPTLHSVGFHDRLKQWILGTGH